MLSNYFDTMVTTEYTMENCISYETKSYYFIMKVQMIF